MELTVVFARGVMYVPCLIGGYVVLLSSHESVPERNLGKILVLDLQQNSRKTAQNVLKLILLSIKSGFVERKCVILLLCCVIW